LPFALGYAGAIHSRRDFVNGSFVRRFFGIARVLFAVLSRSS